MIKRCRLAIAFNRPLASSAATSMLAICYFHSCVYTNIRIYCQCAGRGFPTRHRLGSTPASGGCRTAKEVLVNVDRAVFALAGSLLLISLALAWLVSPYWLLLAAFVGANMLQAAFTGFCPAAMVFRKLGLKAGPAFGGRPPRPERGGRASSPRSRIALDQCGRPVRVLDFSQNARALGEGLQELNISGGKDGSDRRARRRHRRRFVRLRAEASGPQGGSRHSRLQQAVLPIHAIQSLGGGEVAVEERYHHRPRHGAAEAWYCIQRRRRQARSSGRESRRTRRRHVSDL